MGFGASNFCIVQGSTVFSSWFCGTVSFEIGEKWEMMDRESKGLGTAESCKPFQESHIYPIEVQIY